MWVKILTKSHLQVSWWFSCLMSFKSNIINVHKIKNLKIQRSATTRMIQNVKYCNTQK